MQFLQRNFAVDSVIKIYTKTWKLGHKLKHKLEQTYIGTRKILQNFKQHN